jgi:hypothetical protein
MHGSRLSIKKTSGIGLSIGLPERFTSLQEGRLTIGRRIPSCTTMAHAVSASIRKYPPHIRNSEDSSRRSYCCTVGI